MLTVLIATYRGADTLPRVLASYTRLREPDGGWKLVVVDNGSDDDSAAIAKSFSGRLPIVVLSEPRRGKNSALNTGLRELAGDLALLSDDDTIPDADWLVEWRTVADRRPDYAMFGGPIVPAWDAVPPEWVTQWVRMAPVFGLTDPAWEDGPCDPARLWGPNMVVRAGLFAKGHRFDERFGPNGSSTYAMGSETEFVMRVSAAECLRCWYHRNARVRHIITPAMLTRSYVLKRAFRLGRRVHRHASQNALAGHTFVDRSASASCRQLARESLNLAIAHRTADPRGVFEARWQLNLWFGCLFEAVKARRETRRVSLDARRHR
jgi:glycosyltransferase involved in cell wall biosynthesis